MNESRRKDLFPNVSDAEWNDWKWQVANRIETLEDLKVCKTYSGGGRGCQEDTLYPQDGHYSILHLFDRP